MPRDDLRTSLVNVFSISAKASAGSSANRMAALASGFSKPGNLVLGVKPAGGTRPTRELTGNTGSAARTGAAARNRASAPRMAGRSVRDGVMTDLSGHGAARLGQLRMPL
jgi:hypothetical protein